MKGGRPEIEKSIVWIVCLVSVFFLAAGGLLGVWHAREMRTLAGTQFNHEQLSIARNLAGLIERELGILRKEVLLLCREISEESPEPETAEKPIRRSLSRVLESGVRRIEVLDLEQASRYQFMPYRPVEIQAVENPESELAAGLGAIQEKTVRIFRPEMTPSGISMAMAGAVEGDSSRFVLFHLSITWFLAPFMKDIRSGTTGYAWLIDDLGTFLYHPKTDFLGQDAFIIREKQNPPISFDAINAIQKDRMLAGEEGMGTFVSGWHRGITGEIRKLIAFCPVSVCQQPIQRWSVAVVAPISEIEDAVRAVYRRQMIMQGLILSVILSGAASLLWFERRWTHRLEHRVQERTEELKRSEEKYRSLVESAEDFIFTIDSSGAFQSMNSFTANYFGGRPEDFLGKPISSLFPESVSEKQLKLIQLVFEHGKSIRDEFELQMGEHRIWLSANFMPLKNREECIAATLCIARDITENKNLERQLVNAEKLASLGTLAAGVAHEINNPLGVILGFCDLLLRKAEKESQSYEDLKTIERQGLHCKEVVENLLSFARLGKGKDEHADLNRCLEDILRVVRHTLELKNIELTLFLSEGIPKVKSDPRQLQQVLLNIINNAVAAMDRGGSLTIRTYAEKAARKAVIQFQDTGIGIPAANLEHIFEPFFTTKPEGEGTGLGLFVSYGIISKYGGTIDCTSQTATEGKPGGTTFTIKLLTR